MKSKNQLPVRRNNIWHKTVCRACAWPKSQPVTI